MDSLPQELIDSIIDNVPGSSLLSCSLIARRWRRKSQQRVLDVIAFSSEDEVNRWWTDIPQDPGGITSYVRSVQFVEIPYWDEPTLFGRVLKNLTSVRELTISETEVPDELLDHISHGEFGKEITTLYFWFPRCTLATMASMILSLPNLKELGVDDGGVTSEEPLPIHSVTSRRKRLDSLQLYGNVNGIGEILAKSRFIASRLCLDLHIPGAPQLLMLSSEMVVELNLCDTPAGVVPPPVPLLSLPTLTTLAIDLCMDVPSPRLTSTLCSIGSAPALTSVAVGFVFWDFVETLPAGPWADVDEWLSRIAKHTKIKGGLSLTLTLWPEGKSVWEGFLHGFKACGGKIGTSDT